MPQFFKEVPGFPNYIASIGGAIYSRPRRIWNGRQCGGVFLKPSLAQGRKTATVSLLRTEGVNEPHPFGRRAAARAKTDYTRGGRRWQGNVGAVVLAAFRGPAPAGTECCHNDGDFTNNALGNLRWDTPTANNADTARHGRCAGAAKDPDTGRFVSGTSAAYGHGTPKAERLRRNRECRARRLAALTPDELAELKARESAASAGRHKRRVEKLGRGEINRRAAANARQRFARMSGAEKDEVRRKRREYIASLPESERERRREYRRQWLANRKRGEK